jgi:DNA polymerase-3 subunit delta'
LTLASLRFPYVAEEGARMRQAVPQHHRIAEKIARNGRARGMLGHSLLVHGPVGAGQREVALKLGQSVFCETGEGTFGACGECRNCRRVLKGTHPDFIWLEPDRKAKGLPNISIDLLRSLQDRLVLEPFEGPKVVGCLYEAEKMRPEAANSLLKLVEEPPPHAQFILVTESRQRILTTIRSRCLPIPLAPPSAETVVERLMEGSGWEFEEARQATLWALNEGLAPEEARSEPVARFREESLELLESAFRQGESNFLFSLKNLKHDRETMARYLSYWRDFLRETLLLAEGRGEVKTYESFTPSFQDWSKKVRGEDLADLIDLSHDLEEALMGYCNPVHTLGAFLSAVSSKAHIPQA